MSWLQPVSDGVALQWSRLGGGPNWGPASTVVSSARLLPNAADTPAVVSLGSDRLVAHWRETREPAGAGNDVKVALSFDGGKQWENAVTPHRDGTDTEHGFVAVFEASLVSSGSEPRVPGGPSSADITGSVSQATGAANGSRDPMSFSAGIAWLDGRQAATQPEAYAAQMIATTLETGGNVGLGVEQVLDERTCDCCPVAMANAGGTTLLAYRDRSPEDYRDIALLRRRPDGQWSQPLRVHVDAWHVVGCPVNGPALDAEGPRAVVAWFTASMDDPRVLVAFSADSGLSWAEPVRIDDVSGATSGQPAVALLPDGSALVLWVVRRETGLALMARRVVPGSSPEPARQVAFGISGIPQLARTNGHVLAAWTQVVEATGSTASTPDEAQASGAAPAPAVAGAARQVRCAAWTMSEVVPSD